MKRFRLLTTVLAFLCLPSISTWANDALYYGPYTYDIFMRAEKGSWSTCAVAFDYDRELLPDPADGEEFDLVVSDATKHYALHIDDRLGWARLTGLGRYVGVLIPHNCAGRHEVGEEIAQIANEQQSYFVVKVVSLPDSEILKYRSSSIRREYGISKEEWRLRQHAVRYPCKPDSWRALATYHQEYHLRSGSDEPYSFVSMLMLVYSTIIAGSTVDDALDQHAPDLIPDARDVIRNIFRYQIPRFSC